MSDFRFLAPDEIPLLLPLARAFFAEGNLPGTLNERHFVATLKAHITRGTGFVIAAGLPIRGTVSGIMFNDMATAELCCMEFFWYVSAEERGSLGIRLLDAMETEAFKRGSVRVLMSHLSTPKTERFERVYARRGYTKREQIFMKGKT